MKLAVQEDRKLQETRREISGGQVLYTAEDKFSRSVIRRDEETKYMTPEAAALWQGMTREKKRRMLREVRKKTRRKTGKGFSEDRPGEGQGIRRKQKTTTQTRRRDSASPHTGQPEETSLSHAVQRSHTVCRPVSRSRKTVIRVVVLPREKKAAAQKGAAEERKDMRSRRSPLSRTPELIWVSVSVREKVHKKKVRKRQKEEPDREPVGKEIQKPADGSEHLRVSAAVNRFKILNGGKIEENSESGGKKQKREKLTEAEKKVLAARAEQMVKVKQIGETANRVVTWGDVSKQAPDEKEATKEATGILLTPLRYMAENAAREASSTVLAVVGKVLAAVFSAVIGLFSLLLPILLPVVVIFAIIVLVVALIGSVLGGLFANTYYGSYSSEYDAVCYLSAKYESGGDPDNTGGDYGWACGEFQFDCRYSLNSFINWCYNDDVSFYSEFEPYLSMSTELRSNDAFYSAWHTICASDKRRFELAQMEYAVTYYLTPVLEDMTEYYAYDFNNASDALKGCILSFSIRDGASLSNMRRYFDGTTSESTEEEIITAAYDAMIARRSTIPRWRYEKEDCLALLAGELNIYEADGNAAGSIDWSWKAVLGSSSGIGEQVVSIALSHLGATYSQTYRTEPGYYDCSSLVFRCYAEVGVTYLNGMTAAEEARYLENHGMTFTDASQLEPGDLIFFAGSGNGRYRNISHVAIYAGDGMLVEASSSQGRVVYREARYSNINLYGRPLLTGSE